MMDRRELLTVFGMALAAPLSLFAGPAPTSFGYIDVESARARGYDPATARVFVNGVEVTVSDRHASGKRVMVMACDDKAGYIEVLARDVNGDLKFDRTTGEFARRRVYGSVRLTMSPSVGVSSGQSDA
jgi:hypothetical protein